MLALDVRCFGLVIGAVAAGLESLTVQDDDLASREPDDSPLHYEGCAIQAAIRLANTGCHEEDAKRSLSERASLRLQGEANALGARFSLIREFA